MIIDLRMAMMNRACAALEDVRADAIGQAFALQPAAAWIVARMEEQPQVLTRFAIRRRLHRPSLALLRNVQALGPLMVEIRDALGADAILTEPDGYRLTPLGRIRIRIALKEPVL